MMRLGRRATLLVAFYLLTSAATAHAECAWVVWTHTLSDDPAVSASGRWLAQTAFHTRAECVQDVDQKRAVYFGKRKLDKYTYEMGSFCLPDTVNPRGPKGK